MIVSTAEHQCNRSQLMVHHCCAPRFHWPRRLRCVEPMHAKAWQKLRLCAPTRASEFQKLRRCCRPTRLTTSALRAQDTPSLVVPAVRPSASDGSIHLPGFQQLPGPNSGSSQPRVQFGFSSSESPFSSRQKLSYPCYFRCLTINSVTGRTCSFNVMPNSLRNHSFAIEIEISPPQ